MLGYAVEDQAGCQEEAGHESGQASQEDTNPGPEPTTVFELKELVDSERFSRFVQSYDDGSFARTECPVDTSEGGAVDSDPAQTTNEEESGCESGSDYSEKSEHYREWDIQEEVPETQSKAWPWPYKYSCGHPKCEQGIESCRWVLPRRRSEARAVEVPPIQVEAPKILPIQVEPPKIHCNHPDCTHGEESCEIDGNAARYKSCCTQEIAPESIPKVLPRRRSETRAVELLPVPVAPPKPPRVGAPNPIIGNKDGGTDSRRGSLFCALTETEATTPPNLLASSSTGDVGCADGGTTAADDPDSGRGESDLDEFDEEEHECIFTLPKPRGVESVVYTCCEVAKWAEPRALLFCKAKWWTLWLMSKKKPLWYNPLMVAHLRDYSVFTSRDSSTLQLLLAEHRAKARSMRVHSSWVDLTRAGSIAFSMRETADEVVGKQLMADKRGLKETQQLLSPKNLTTRRTKTSKQLSTRTVFGLNPSVKEFFQSPIRGSLKVPIF